MPPAARVTLVEPTTKASPETFHHNSFPLRISRRPQQIKRSPSDLKASNRGLPIIIGQPKAPTDHILSIVTPEYRTHSRDFTGEPSSPKPHPVRFLPNQTKQSCRFKNAPSGRTAARKASTRYHKRRRLPSTRCLHRRTTTTALGGV